jgi:hypothetical protein
LYNCIIAVNPRLSAKLVQIFDGHRPAARVEEAFPWLNGGAGTR